jgi:hypothetical protein
MTEGTWEGTSRNGVVAEILKAPEGAHERSDGAVDEPRTAFVPSVPKAKALNPPRKKSRRFNMVIPRFRGHRERLCADAHSE